VSFVRAEVRAGLWRWREVLGGAAALALGLYWIAGGQGLLFWVGWPVVAIGSAWIAVGLPRGRFRGAAGDGPGVVQVVEGQVSYFGPLTGGVIDLDALQRLSLDATGHPAHWRLDAPGADPLHIPVTATGAETLFDAFQTLPGLNTRALLEARRQRDGRQVVWSRPH
jgi:hypothetical protein